MKTLQLDIVTPSRAALSVACEDVYLPASDGEMGILDSHESYVTVMGTGIVRIKKSDGDQLLCVRGGFVEVSENSITLLADEVKFKDEIESSTLSSSLATIDEKIASNIDSAVLQAQLLDEKKWVETLLEFTS